MNGFTIYKEYYDLITLLPEKEQQELLIAIVKYMFEDIEPCLNGRQIKIFNNLKRPLDKSKKRSQSGSNKNQNQSENETKEKQNEIKTKSNEKQNENKNETHQDVNVNVIVNDNVNVKNIENIKRIIEYLNLKTKSSYKYSTDKTQKLINTRLSEGYTIDDFKLVIDKKYKEWVGTDFEKFLRPETLFGNKFESYLNQKTNNESNQIDEQWELLKGVYDGQIKID